MAVFAQDLSAPGQALICSVQRVGPGSTRWEATGCTLPCGRQWSPHPEPHGLSLCRFPGPGWARSCARLRWREQGQGVCSIQTGACGCGSRHQCTALSILAVGKSACAHGFKGESRLEASVRPNGSPRKQGGLSPLHWTLELVCPDCGSTCLLSRARSSHANRLFSNHSQGCRFQPDTFISILPSHMKIFLGSSGCIGVLPVSN